MSHDFELGSSNQNKDYLLYALRPLCGCLIKKNKKNFQTLVDNYSSPLWFVPISSLPRLTLEIDQHSSEFPGGSKPDRKLSWAITSIQLPWLLSSTRHPGITLMLVLLWPNDSLADEVLHEMVTIYLGKARAIHNKYTGRNGITHYQGL